MRRKVAAGDDELPRYALYDEIASGGMASVLFGRRLGPAGFSRVVAIKKLHPQFAHDPEFSAMLRDEARLASRVRHANVVSTLDVVDDGSELLLVMEYVAGEALSRLVGQARAWQEPVPIEIAVAIAAAILHGLHAAHDARSDDGEPLGIVHRDVSPQNVLVGADGVARLVDFGVAKATGRCHVTREGQLKGKLPYMAPEQCRGEPVSRLCDIWSASAVAWEMLVGRRLFDGATEPQIYGQVMSGRIHAPGKLAAAIPAELDAVILRGLQRAPERRYGTAREMALALESCLRPATSAEVGLWVARLAGPTLEARARRIAAIERGDGSSAASPPAAVYEATELLDAPETTLPLEEPTTLLDELSEEQNPALVTEMAAAVVMPPPRTRRPRRSWIAMGAAGVVSGAIAGSLVSAPPAPLELGLALEPSWRAAAAIPGPAAAPPPPPAASEAPPPPSAARSARRPPSKPSPAASSARDAAPTARDERCYTLDADGVWHIRPECL